MSIFQNIESGFQTVWENFKGYFTADVEPILRDFLEQFATADGQLILTSAITAVATLAGGAPFATVAEELVTTLISKSETIAAQSALTTLQQVQSALSIAKITQHVVAPADTVSLEKIATPAA